MTSVYEEGRLKQLYDTLGYAAVGVPYSYYKDVISQKKEHQSISNTLRNTPRVDPYPKHVGREAKIKEHIREANLQVGNRLARLMSLKSLAEAENMMTEPFVSSVLNSQLDILQSGVDPSTFFQTIGVPDADAAYDNFKQAMVASVMASWRAYNNKQTVTSLDTEHVKMYFQKRLGEELKLNWGSLLDSSGPQKQVFTMAKIGSPSAAAARPLSDSKPVAGTAPSIRKLIPSSVRTFVDCHLLLDKHRHRKSHKKAASSDEESDTYSDEGSSSSSEESSEEEQAPPVKAPAISPITPPSPVSSLPSAEPDEVRPSAAQTSISLGILRSYAADHPEFLASIKNPTFFIPSDRVWNSYRDPNIVASVSARPLGFLSTHVASKVAPGHFVTVSQKTVRMSDGGIGSGLGSAPVLTEPVNLKNPKTLSVSTVNIAGTSVTLVQIDQALPK